MDKVCDTCVSQEGRHYCLLHSRQMRDMNVETCPDWEQRPVCRCDLDRWQPEKDTGHSWVCPIHKAMKRRHANATEQAHAGSASPGSDGSQS